MSQRSRVSNYSSPAVALSYITKTSSTLGNCTTSAVPGLPTTQNSNQVQLVDNRTMVDEVTPSFKYRSAKGEIINSPMTATRTITSVTPMKICFIATKEAFGCSPSRWYPYKLWDWQGEVDLQTYLTSKGKWMFETAPSFTASEIKANEELAITKAHSNIDVSEILVLATLAESGKSIVGLTKLLRSVYRVLRKTKRLELNSLRKSITLKDTVNLYMEARYNLRPMYYDVLGILKALSQKKLAAHRQTFRSNREITKETSSNSTYQLFTDSGIVINHTLRWNSKLVHEARAGVLTQLDELTTGQIWGADRIVDTIWELIPFSFIVDWFINVGDTISSWVPDCGAHVLASWVMSKQTLIQSLSSDVPVITLYPRPDFRFQGTTCTYQASALKTVTTKVRTPNYSRPVIPNISVKLDALKLLDLAIITGLIKSTRPRNSFRI